VCDHVVGTGKIYQKALNALCGELKKREHLHNGEEPEESDHRMDDVTDAAAVSKSIEEIMEGRLICQRITTPQNVEECFTFLVRYYR